MRIDVTVPNVGESITEVEIGEWLKNKGDSVDKNEPLLTVESDKATVEIRAPESATLIDILKNSGDSAAVGEVIAHLEAKSGRAQTTATESRRPQPEAQPPRSNGADAPRGDGATSGSERIVQEVAPSELANKRENQAAEQPPKEETPPSARDVQIIEAKETTAQQVQDTESPEQPPEPSTGNGQPAEEQGESIFPGGTATSISQRDEAVRMTALRRLIAEKTSHQAWLHVVFRQGRRHCAANGARSQRGDSWR